MIRNRASQRVFALVVVTVLTHAVQTQAAHERSIPRLVQRLQQATQTAQVAYQTGNGFQLGTALGNASVQAQEAVIHASSQLGQLQSLGEFTDPSAVNGLPYSTTRGALNELENAVLSAAQSLQQQQMQGVYDGLFWAAIHANAAYYFQFQNGFVNPNGSVVAGVGACFEIDGDKAYMAGVIDDRITNRLNAVLGNRQVKTIVMVNVPGSSNDAANTQAALRLRNKRLNTALINGGAIESGGVDFFLAGVQRIGGTSPFVGVHSWAGNNLSGFAVRNNRNHPSHRIYVNYYNQIGTNPNFYWFTLGFTPDDMHYMTAAELAQYGIFTGSGSVGPINPGNGGQSLAGIWQVVQTNAPGLTIAITPQGRFTATRANGTSWSGEVSLQNGLLVSVADDGSRNSLQAVRENNRITFPGQTFIWVRDGGAINPPPEPPQFTINGQWIERRRDGRAEKRISIQNGRITERINGRVTMQGNVRIQNNRLTISSANSSESFQLATNKNGNRIDFRDGQTGAVINRFYWVRP